MLARPAQQKGSAFNERTMTRKRPRSLTIGIPRTLYYYSYPGLWETFFKELGMVSVLAEPSTRRTVETAGLISEAEHCLPMKMFDAHLVELIDKVDMIFVPRILSSQKGRIACPKLGALPDATRAQFRRPEKVLTEEINEDKTPLPVTLAALGKRLGVGSRQIRAAIPCALAVMKKTRARLSKSRGGGSRRVLILAHPYNLYDDYFSRPIIRKLERLGVGIDMMDFDRHTVPDGPIKWDTCSQMYNRLQELDSGTCQGVIQISSFNCGCDSIVGRFYAEILREKGIPYMTIVLDEHTSTAGLETRLEAFVDSCRW